MWREEEEGLEGKNVDGRDDEWEENEFPRLRLPVSSEVL